MLRTPDIKTGAVDVPAEKTAGEKPAVLPTVQTATAEQRSANEKKTATFISINSNLKIQMEPAEMEYLGNAGMRTARHGVYISFIGGSYATAKKKEIDFIMSHPLFNSQVFANPEDPTGFWADYREKNPQSALDRDASLPDTALAAETASTEAQRLTGLTAKGMESSRSYEGGNMQAIEADGRSDLTETVLIERGLIKPEAKFARTTAFGKEINPNG